MAAAPQNTAQELIQKLNLEPHPLEGGHYTVSYVSKLEVKPLDATRRDRRSCFSFIYFLIQNNNHIPWHKLSSDEMFSYHRGCPLRLYTLREDGSFESTVVGDPLVDPQAHYVAVIPANTWFAGELMRRKHSYCLCSVSVSPGFVDADCEFADVSKLAEQFPQQSEIIRKFPAGPLKI
ncbi:predicted protein [Nematostella vectensis]|uniref:DUF985 domain-containing protein n=1 Tax=Nematostella vectensis TaxID=45351 RepID=A7RGZ0_NEMVE|nr:predicted protein [Nematostella vectensis]|eukprot:XP_001641198.1 predicted protein [Nematostella vectensis]